MSDSADVQEQPQQQQGEAPVASQQEQQQNEQARRYRLATGEDVDERELLAEASGRRLDTRAVEAMRKRLEELEEFQARVKRSPMEGLSREDRRRLALEEARAWQEEEEELALPPEQRALRARERKLREREEALRLQEDERTKAAEAEQLQAMRAEAVDAVKRAMEIAGLPRTPAVAKHLLEVMAEGARRGVMYPPEVLARRLRVSWEQGTQEALSGLGGKQLLQRMPKLVELLNALDDPAALKLLGPLGDRLRKLNLSTLGIDTGAQPAPSEAKAAPGRASPADPVDPWEAQRRIEERARRK